LIGRRKIKGSVAVRYVFMLSTVDHAGWKEKFLFFLGRFRRLKVDGNSMEPTLQSGDIVLYDPMGTVKIGDIALTSHPYIRDLKILKRVSEIGADGKLFLIGDNETDSTDSRTLGWFSPQQVKGKVVCRWK